MVRICLETCRTVEEAAELFGSVRIWFPCEVNHILLADSSRAVGVVEFDRSRLLAVGDAKSVRFDKIITHIAWNPFLVF